MASRITMRAVSMTRSARSILSAAEHWQLWGTLGLHDIKHKYRRSLIGPFWITIQTGVWVLSIGVLYAGLFKQDISVHIPYVAAGKVIWVLVSGIIIDMTGVYIDSSHFIKQLALNKYVFLYRVLVRNLVILAHNLVLMLMVYLYFWIFYPGYLPNAVLGLVMVVINASWIGLLFGLISARFRDVPQFVYSILNLMLILTPIFWSASASPNRWFVALNPLYYLIEAGRAPLLGQDFPPNTLLACCLLALFGWTFTLWLYSRYEWRISYWL